MKFSIFYSSIYYTALQGGKEDHKKKEERRQCRSPIAASHIDHLHPFGNSETLTKGGKEKKVVFFGFRGGSKKKKRGGKSKKGEKGGGVCRAVVLPILI